MGLLDELFPRKKNKEEPNSPFRIHTKFVPLRLTAREKNKTTLYISVKNITDEKQLVSIDVKLPERTGIGFDSAGRYKRVEKKLEWIEPGKEKETAIDIYSNGSMREGDYNIEIIVYMHDRSYDRVLRYVKKYESIRAV